MALYYSWIVTGGLCAGFLAGAESHDERRIVWALVGTACVALWFILRHWTIPFVHRRGILDTRSRGALVLMALALALIAAGFLVRTVSGQTAGVISPGWLEVICSFFVWWYLYVGIEIWVN
jgi:hypothetical protein